MSWELMSWELLFEQYYFKYHPLLCFELMSLGLKGIFWVISSISSAFTTFSPFFDPFGPE